MFRARIEVEAKHPDAIYKALLPESKEGKRFTASISLEGGNVLIDIDARDPTALRAALNSYLRLLSLLDDIEEGL